MELEVTWGRAVKVWWSYFWRSMIAAVAAILIGILVGMILGFILALMGASLEVVQTFSGIVGGLIGLLASIVPFKLILGKDFGEYRLVLLPGKAYGSGTDDQNSMNH